MSNTTIKNQERSRTFFILYAASFIIFLIRTIPHFREDNYESLQGYAMLFLFVGCIAIESIITLKNSLKDEHLEGVPGNWIVRSILYTIGAIFPIVGGGALYLCSALLYMALSPTIYLVKGWINIFQYHGGYLAIYIFSLVVLTIPALILTSLLLLVWHAVCCFDAEMLGGMLSSDGSGGGGITVSSKGKESKGSLTNDIATGMVVYGVAKQHMKEEAKRQEAIKKDPLSEFRI